MVVVIYEHVVQSVPCPPNVKQALRSLSDYRQAIYISIYLLGGGGVSREFAYSPLPSEAQALRTLIDLFGGPSQISN